MRVGFGLLKNEHGVWCVRKKVPKGLETVVATVTGASKTRVAWLKKSLRTKDEKRAKVLAPPVMMEFDRTLARAKALLVERPVRTELSEHEIKQVADYFYAHELATDQELREEGGVCDDELYAKVHKQHTDAGISYGPWPPEVPKPGSGLSARMMHEIRHTLDIVLPAVRAALARGNINFIRYELDELLKVFGINLDPNCLAYRRLAMEVMKSEVRALEAIVARHQGEPVDSPKLIEPQTVKFNGSGASLRSAYEGWIKMEDRGVSTTMEYERAIGRFIELHGDLEVGQINRRHVREFRQAAQQVPKMRAGRLRSAPLPELVEWSREHPEAERIAASTVNKWLTCLQSVLNWA